MHARRAIATNAAPSPGGAYSQGIVVGELVFVAGQAGFDPATGELVEGGTGAQTERTLRNVEAVLAEAGASLADVVKTTVHLADIADFPDFDAAYRRIVPAPHPVRTTVASSLPGIAVEIDVVARLPRGAALRSATLSDALDAAGLRDRALERGIRPLAPGMALEGRARTAQLAPVEHDSDAPYDEMIDFIDSLAPGDVVVLAAPVLDRCALWGELFSAAARGRGATGVICDGAVRDSAGIEELLFPVFARARRPEDMRSRARVVAVDAQISCGGVVIAPGDRVVADDDGVVVCPAERSDVLDAARDKAAREDTVLRELLGGATLRSVWERHGVL